jgi:hypothetical protein
MGVCNYLLYIIPLNKPKSDGIEYFNISLLDLFARPARIYNQGMGKREAAADAKAVLFKRLYGVKPDTFEKMKSILQKEFDILHRRGGKPPKLTVEDKLYITLKYPREYRTMESIGDDYGVGKSAVCETIQWVEDALIKDKTFRPPTRKF